MRYLLAFVLLAGLAAQATAQIQVRTLPTEAARAQLRFLYDTTVSLDGKERKLAPGAQIRDDSNRVVVPSAVLGTVTVKYLADPDGALRQVWILTADEAAQKQP
ncbi:MAG TPA: hypothetical protein VF943_00670 [Burkholderiales bacterium]